jgi:hypothetical protein
MTVTRIALAAGLGAALGSCAPRREAPAPTPAPVQRPVYRPSPPTPAPPAPAPGWVDAPLSAGDWTYDESRASAAFGPAGQPSFVLRCVAPGQVALERHGAAPATGGTLTFRTSTTARTVAARSGPAGLVATMPASDPLLDAIVFSRGRFAVEAGMLPTLIVPAWPEPARVIEDCRG